MNFKFLNAGHNIPQDVNVVIEIASNSYPVKYEFDKESGMIKVDRFLRTAFSYPCEYGFIPQTLSEDGDPVDMLVVSPYPLQPGCIISCRPVGVLNMQDESGFDAKILAVPSDKLLSIYKDIQKPADLGEEYLNKIGHFFQHYKDLEPGKWAKVGEWGDVDSAYKEILASVERYKNQKSTQAV